MNPDRVVVDANTALSHPRLSVSICGSSCIVPAYADSTAASAERTSSNFSSAASFSPLSGSAARVRRLSSISRVPAAAIIGWGVKVKAVGQ